MRVSSVIPWNGSDIPPPDVLVGFLRREVAVVALNDAVEKVTVWSHGYDARLVVELGQGGNPIQVDYRGGLALPVPSDTIEGLRMGVWGNIQSSRLEDMIPQFLQFCKDSDVEIDPQDLCFSPSPGTPDWYTGDHSWAADSLLLKATQFAPLYQASLRSKKWFLWQWQAFGKKELMGVVIPFSNHKLPLKGVVDFLIEERVDPAEFSAAPIDRHVMVVGLDALPEPRVIEHWATRMGVILENRKTGQRLNHGVDVPLGTSRRASPIPECVEMIVWFGKRGNFLRGTVPI